LPNAVIEQHSAPLITNKQANTVPNPKKGTIPLFLYPVVGRTSGEIRVKNELQGAFAESNALFPQKNTNEWGFCEWVYIVIHFEKSVSF